MLYLEDYLEMIEHLPQELRDRFTDMREMDLTIHISGRERARKAVPNPEKWKRAIVKKRRYCATGFPDFPTCSHSQGAFHCKTLTIQDIRRFYQKFYENKDKVSQGNFIILHISLEPIQRRRLPKNPAITNKKQKKAQETRAKYFIPDREKCKVPVCMQTFLKCLKISRFRVNRLSKYFRDGIMPKERRGGDHTGDRFGPKKEAIMKFINRFKCSETHYCSNKGGRKYLPSELNIKKLWRIFCADEKFKDMGVKEYNMDELEKRVKNFFSDCKRCPNDLTQSVEAEFQAIRKEYYKTLEEADEKTPTDSSPETPTINTEQTTNISCLKTFPPLNPNNYIPTQLPSNSINQMSTNNIFYNNSNSTNSRTFKRQRPNSPDPTLILQNEIIASPRSQLPTWEY
ncbi:unnamed protein product [Diabrotica balteata]|uniref:Inhibitor of growth protein N-terminal histone-binding domain-containing protein n=1 Tax=Diabrotica balteata TaxID=107213 RepID=A0A9N9SQV3_DIABA|nr:unnamed protein product [Diabrotica balteata]